MPTPPWRSPSPSPPLSSSPSLSLLRTAPRYSRQLLKALAAGAASATMPLSSSLRPCFLIPNPFPSLLPSYATGSLMQVLLSLCQHDTARLTRCRCFEQWAACSQPPAGPHAATAAWLAAVFCVRHHRLQVHRRGRVRSRALERAAPASVAAAAACATPPRTHRACLRVCILLAASGAGRGAEKVPKSKVALRRSFRFPACGVRA